MKLVKIKGTPYEMGLQYGQQCKKEIKTFVRLLYMMVSRMSMPDMKAVHPKFWYIFPALFRLKNEKKKFRSLTNKHEEWVKKYYSDAIEQIKGIAEGAEVSYEDVLVINILTEYTYGLHHCSAWSACGKATKTGEPFLGMHSDEEKGVSKYEIILQVEPINGYKYIGTTLTGTILPAGAMNEKGLATGAPLLLWVRSGGDMFDHMPLMSLFRVLNECASIDEALELYEAFPNPAVSVSLHLADKNKIARIEFAKKERNIDVIENGTLYNCNMAMSEKIKKYDIVHEVSEKFTYNAFPRTKRMGELMEKYYGRIDEEAMKAIARDHGEGETKSRSICQHVKPFSAGLETIGSFIAKPKDLKMWISVGAQPCTQEYEEFTF